MHPSTSDPQPQQTVNSSKLGLFRLTPPSQPRAASQPQAPAPAPHFAPPGAHHLRVTVINKHAIPHHHRPPSPLSPLSASNQATTHPKQPPKQQRAHQSNDRHHTRVTGPARLPPPRPLLPAFPVFRPLTDSFPAASSQLSIVTRHTPTDHGLHPRPRPRRRVRCPVRRFPIASANYQIMPCLYP